MKKDIESWGFHFETMEMRLAMITGLLNDYSKNRDVTIKECRAHTEWGLRQVPNIVHMIGLIQDGFLGLKDVNMDQRRARFLYILTKLPVKIQASIIFKAQRSQGTLELAVSATELDVIGRRWWLAEKLAGR